MSTTEEVQYAYEDGHLLYCNQSELLELARIQGLGFLKESLPKDRLVALITGAAQTEPSDFAETQKTRAELEAFIYKQIDKVRSQLPGCTGRCTTYPCSDTRHALCFLPSRGGMK